MAQGREQLVYFSSTGLVSGAKIQVEMQGDLKIDPGKDGAVSTYKNGQNAAISDKGFNLTFTMGLLAPMGPGQSLAFLQTDNPALSAYFWVLNTRSGGLQYDGACVITVGEVGSPTNGDTVATVNVMAQGTVNRTQAP